MNIEKLEPEGFSTLLSVEAYLFTTSLSNKDKELIKIRASQLNACAYCIEMHTSTARKHGETESRIYALNAWEESPLFTDEEKALLSVTEEVTFIAEKGLTEDTFQNARKYFSDQLIMQAIIQAAMINTWNRIAISSRSVHPNNLAKMPTAASIL
jgi:AhpD family alkylhydroperoxidase